MTDIRQVLDLKNLEKKNRWAASIYNIDLTPAAIPAASILAHAISSAALPDLATPGTARHLTFAPSPFSQTTSETAE